MSRRAPLPLALALLAACAGAPAPGTGGLAPRPAADPRPALRAGLHDAQEAAWNLRVLSRTRPQGAFAEAVHTDLAFTGNYAIQGSFAGWQAWDLSNAAAPERVAAVVCPGAQGDVSVHRHLLFVSGEGREGRRDCGDQGVPDAASADRLLGLRIYDISDLRAPRPVALVQTCRGSHTHTVVEDPRDSTHVYVYISGSAPVRDARELAGCSAEPPAVNPASALFRIEVVEVPLANPAAAAVVSTPRLFEGLAAPPMHGMSPADTAAIARARARGDFVAELPDQGETVVLPPGYVALLLDSLVTARQGTGAPTAVDSAALRAALPAIIARLMGSDAAGSGPRPGPTQCHDITVYPALGVGAGACEGYGLLLDLRDPAQPRRVAAVADSNFAYWHSAIFNNDGTTVLFADEWGGGRSPRCRAGDPREWGADALFTVRDGTLAFRGYHKLPAAQGATENCVAHNGGLIPVPGRDVLVQAWYQGGISVVDFTDPARPVEIAYFDRGPADSTRLANAGAWSAYWYNGLLVSSEIARGLDLFELLPSPHLTQNEIDAANTVRLRQLNPQAQPRFTWPPSFALVRAYLDQVERSRGLSVGRILDVRTVLAAAEAQAGAPRREALRALGLGLGKEVAGSADAPRLLRLIEAIKALATAG